MAANTGHPLAGGGVCRGNRQSHSHVVLGSGRPRSNRAQRPLLPTNRNRGIRYESEHNISPGFISTLQAPIDIQHHRVARQFIQWSSGWAGGYEEGGGGEGTAYTLHWLIPLITVDRLHKQARFTRQLNGSTRWFELATDSHQRRGKDTRVAWIISLTSVSLTSRSEKTIKNSYPRP